jgi:hypothetical protein
MLGIRAAVKMLKFELEKTLPKLYDHHFFPATLGGMQIRLPEPNMYLRRNNTPE